MSVSGCGLQAAGLRAGRLQPDARRACSLQPGAWSLNALTRPQLLDLYYYIRLTRDIEERLVLLYRQSKVVGGLYRSLGQEGESVASAYALGPEDALAPLIRNLGSIVALGVRPRDIFAQYMARGISPTRGRDLNVHFSHMPAPGSGERTLIGPDQHARAISSR